MNLEFDFRDPPVNPMREPVRPPTAPSADLTAKHCSSMGAEKIERSRERLWKTMLNMYAQRPCTDAEIAEAIGVAPSTISARRAELIVGKKVAKESCGIKKNPRTGVSNSLWQLAPEKNLHE
jgi:hypothetical protein